MNRPLRVLALSASLGALALGACTTLRDARARLVQSPPRCADATVQIYFEPDSDVVGPEGQAVIGQAAETARGCRVEEVEIVGLADAVGAPAANLELSKRRAQSVLASLAAAGLPASDFRLAGAGQAGAVTADGKAQPLRRRADITLRLAPAT